MADDSLARLLERGEEVQVEARAHDARLVVTDRRIAVVSRANKPDLDIPFDGLRRIQFDIERERPATLVIVPQHRDNHPQVLAIPPKQYGPVAQALATIGLRLATDSMDEEEEEAST